MTFAVSTSGHLDRRPARKPNKARPFYVGLKFSRELEAEYQASILESKIWIGRFGMILGLLLNAIYTVWDWLVFEVAFGEVTLIRQLYANSFLIFAIGLTYLPALRTRMNELMGIWCSRLCCILCLYQYS